MKKNLLLLSITILFWVPAELEFFFKLHSVGVLTVGRVLDFLFYIPFVISFIFGFYYGKKEVWKVGFVYFVASLFSMLVNIWDFNNSVEGSWLEYLSLQGLILSLLIQTIAPSILSFFGGVLRERIRLVISK